MLNFQACSSSVPIANFIFLNSYPHQTGNYIHNSCSHYVIIYFVQKLTWRNLHVIRRLLTTHKLL